VLHYVKKLEHWVTLALVLMLAIVVVLSTVELAWTIAKDIAAQPVFFPGIDALLDIFGKFLLVLIGIELLETMRAFANDGTMRAEVVLTAAMIAIARKIIVLEAGHVPALTILGLAALLVAVSFAYQVYVRGRPPPDPERRRAPRLLPRAHPRRMENPQRKPPP
jgi:uncharacterized membrane protein (DUF373 family)